MMDGFYKPTWEESSVDEFAEESPTDPVEESVAGEEAERSGGAEEAGDAERAGEGRSSGSNAVEKGAGEASAVAANAEEIERQVNRFAGELEEALLNESKVRAKKEPQVLPPAFYLRPDQETRDLIDSFTKTNSVSINKVFCLMAKVVLKNDILRERFLDLLRQTKRQWRRKV